MRFVIVDLEGASRDYFSEYQDLIDTLTELEEEAPGTAEEIFVVTFDEANERIGEPVRGDELVAGQSAAKTYYVNKTQVTAWGRALASITTRPESALGAGRLRAAVHA